MVAMATIDVVYSTCNGVNAMVDAVPEVAPLIELRPPYTWVFCI